jgi:CheY-like chemotaxis protein
MQETSDDGAVVTGGHLRPDYSYARLTVADDGTGMDAETLGRVFDPFFSTKSIGRGTGLGLAVVYGIVTAYDGAYTVESRRDRGTTFSIYLPLAEAVPAEAAEARALDPSQGNERVLLVDDEADLLEMMRIGLTRLGYAVTACADPRAALALFRRDPAAWDAVVSDQVMPGMKGFTLISALREIRPDCPIILCTGFSDGTTERQASAAGARGFFVKPVEPYRIAEKIRALRKI